MVTMELGGEVSYKLRQVLIDSDVWVGYYLSDDALHKQAVSGFEHLENNKYVPVISSQIIGEVATVLSHKSGADLVSNFIQDIKATEISILYLNKKTHDRAISIFLEVKKKGISYVDCVNVATMEETGIDTIYAYDKFYHKRFSIHNIAYPQVNVA